MNTCLVISFRICKHQTTISQSRIKIFSSIFFQTCSTRRDLQNYKTIILHVYLKLRLFFKKQENMIFSKKSGLKSFMEAGPQMMLTLNKDRFLENLNCLQISAILSCSSNYFLRNKLSLFTRTGFLSKIYLYRNQILSWFEK